MRKIIPTIFLVMLVHICVCCKVPPDTGPVQLLDFESSGDKTVTIASGAIEQLFLDPLVSDREVVVVSIAGAFRKGKSFLLNYMLRFMYANYQSVAQPEKIINVTEPFDWLGDDDEPLKGFPWKSSTKRETTGIVFWSDIFLHDASDGDKIAIYLMDTQGLFDHQSSPTDNIRIFSLTALMSSVQLMNIYSSLEESHLEYLQFATEIARFTAVEANSDVKPFQKLMFIIRDWISPDEFTYGLKSGNDYVKSYLRVKDFHSAELKAVRQYLQNTFESISCFLMPYPGKTVARISSYDGRWSLIDEEFVDTMKELFPIILAPNNLTVKTINGVPIKAFELSVYIRQYVELFKSENLPEAKTIYESTLDNQFQILMSKAVEVYLQSISLYQDKIKSKDEVENLHLLSKRLALKYFREEKKFGEKEEGEVYLNKLAEKLEKAGGEWKPLTLEFFDKIKDEQREASSQKKLANEAELIDKAANTEFQVADQKFIELQKQILQARYDTAEARRASEVIRKQLAQATKEREDALQREAETRKHFDEMSRKADYFEAQLAEERQNAANRVNQRVGDVRKRDGILQWFGNVGTGIWNFFGFIGKSFSQLFAPNQRFK